MSNHTPSVAGVHVAASQTPRKRKSDKRIKPLLTVTVGKQQIAKLKETATANGSTVSQLVRDALEVAGYAS